MADSSGLISLSAIAALGNPRPLGTSPNSKLLELDADLFLNANGEDGEDTTLFGAVHFWNHDQVFFDPEGVGLYHITLSVSCILHFSSTRPIHVAVSASKGRHSRHRKASSRRPGLSVHQ